MKNMNSILTAAIVLVVSLTVPISGWAAEPTTTDTSHEVPDSMSPQAIQNLVSHLNDEQVEALSHLLAALDESAEQTPENVNEASGTVTSSSSRLLADLGEHLTDRLTSLDDVIAGFGQAIHSLFAGRSAGEIAWFLGLLILIIALGYGLEVLYNRLVARHRERIRTSSPDNLGEVLRALSRRAALELGGVVTFAVAAVIAANLLISDPDGRSLAIAFIVRIIVVIRVSSSLFKFVLAPQRPELRLVSTNSWTANFICRNFVTLAGIIGVAFFFVFVAEREGTAVVEDFRFWVSTVLHAWIIYVTFRARNGLTSIFKGNEEQLSPGLEKMANWWPTISIVVLALNWLLIQVASSTGQLTLSPAKGALSITLIVIAPFLDTMIRSLVVYFVPASQIEGPVAEKAFEETRHGYVRISRVVLLAILVFVIGKLWGISLTDLTGPESGSQLAANSVAFLLILACGYLLWEISTLWINRRLVHELPQTTAADHEGGEGGGAGLSRMGTILPIVLLTLQVTIVTLTFLLALSQIGVNITPLLAGAGVLGLAIGFGAQTLVKDIVSGVFFLLDDAFRVGEFIDVDGTVGTVEKISVRSLQLRHPRGPIHIIPYGEIPRITNNSRDYVIVKLRFTIPFEADPERVRKLFKKIGQEMMQEPELAECLIEPFKGQGVAEFDDVGIVVRGKFTAKPGKQFQVRKEVFNRVKNAFEENGIEFARKEVRVNIPGIANDAPLSDDQARSVAAVAVEAADNQGKDNDPKK